MSGSDKNTSQANANEEDDQTLDELVDVAVLIAGPLLVLALE